jgi:hypothetical protein
MTPGTAPISRRLITSYYRLGVEYGAVIATTDADAVRTCTGGADFQ